MRETHISLPELALLAGTRAAIGAGLGLLLADRLPDDRRKAVGWTLLLVGAATTIPLAFDVLGGLCPCADESEACLEEAAGNSRSRAGERLGRWGARVSPPA
jgi:hypothetical protein